MCARFQLGESETVVKKRRKKTTSKRTRRRGRGREKNAEGWPIATKGTNTRLATLSSYWHDGEVKVSRDRRGPHQHFRLFDDWLDADLSIKYDPRLFRQPLAFFPLAYIYLISVGEESHGAEREEGEGFHFTSPLGAILLIL